MLCAERMQRIVQAFILGAILTLVGIKLFAAAFILTTGMAFVLFFSGVTGICPGLIILRKTFPPCDKY
jgi:uncharacterized membrane protein HdeD (DUF308 family)